MALTYLPSPECPRKRKAACGTANALTALKEVTPQSGPQPSVTADNIVTVSKLQPLSS